MSRCKTIIIQNNNLKKENRKVKNVFPSLNIFWCRLMSSLTKTKGMKNQREKILSFFKCGKFKVCFTKPLFNRCVYQFITLSTLWFYCFQKLFLCAKYFGWTIFLFLWQMFWFISVQHFCDLWVLRVSQQQTWVIMGNVHYH